MSQTDDIERLAVHLSCPLCHAAAGHWCVTRNGKHATYLHAARVNPVFDLWASAYLEGERDGVAYALEQPGDVVRLRRYLNNLNGEIAKRERSSA